MQSNYFRPAASFLLGDWRGREDATVHDALPEGHGPEHPDPDPGPADFGRSNQPGQEDDQDHAAEENGKPELKVLSKGHLCCWSQGSTPRLDPNLHHFLAGFRKHQLKF